jgi:hypothetical protein
MSLCVYFSRVSGLAECADRQGLPPGHWWSCRAGSIVGPDVCGLEAATQGTKAWLLPCYPCGNRFLRNGPSFQGESQGKKKTVCLSVVPFTSSSFDRWDVDIDIVHKSLFWENLHQVQYTHNLKTQWESWIYFFYIWLQVIQRT